MHCWECPYANKTLRKYGVTTYCNLEPTNMDVSYHVRKKENNKLCPFVCEATKYQNINYDKYVDENIAKWIEESKQC